MKSDSAAAPKSRPLIRRPLLAFLSSMRFAVALLTVLAIASIIGTVLQQNQPMTDYLAKFGPFWFEIFRFLGLFDVYSSPWFVLIMLFLVLSTALCLWRNIPPFLKEMKSFRLKATTESLAAMKHTALSPSGSLNAAVVARYLEVEGFQYRIVEREDGVLIAAKKGSLSKWGYIFAHLAIIVICLGGLIDSNMLMKIKVAAGILKPDNTTIEAKNFAPASRMGVNTVSFRGDISIPEGQGADVVFVNAGDGVLVQDLPFLVKLNQFHVDFYNTGMPKNFASDITVIDKASGKTQNATVRVNHPFTVNGITIYQSSFGDGGSDLTLKAFDLRAPLTEPATMHAVSMNRYPLTLGQEQYQLEFGEFRLFNVENQDAAATPSGSLNQTLHDLKSVAKNKQLQNVGPTISYKIRDSAGQAHEYMNYMQPLERDGARFFAVGERAQLGGDYLWLMMPADKDGKLDSFMLLRRGLADPSVRERAIAAAVAGVPPAQREQFHLAAANLLELFNHNGYLGLDEFIRTKIPEVQRDSMGQLFGQILAATAASVLDVALADAHAAPWDNTEAKGRFVLDSLQALTTLKKFHAPVLLQLTDFKQVKSSGLQMSRSPGQNLVYLGSLLLVLGIICMFYIREKRAWVWLADGTMRFAMGANRHARDLDSEFPEHLRRLQVLAEELG